MTTVTSQAVMETIDLTGIKPVMESRVVQKHITVHHVDDDDGEENNNDVPTSSSNPLISSLVDRRLRYVSYFRLDLKCYTVRP